MLLQRPRALIHHKTSDKEVTRPSGDGLRHSGFLTRPFDLCHTSPLSPLHTIGQPPCITMCPRCSMGGNPASTSLCTHPCWHLSLILSPAEKREVSTKQSCSCCTRPRGGGRVFVVPKGAPPLCKQLTLVAVEGWGPGTFTIFPWHVALGPGRAGQTEEALLRPSDAICRFLRSRGEAVQGEPETGGPTPHQLAPRPASACSQLPPSSSPLRQLPALNLLFTSYRWFL